MVQNLHHFELTPDTTYQQFVYASKSNRVNFYKLLPPEYPDVRIWFRFRNNIEHKLHHDCPSVGSWEGELSHLFSYVDDAVHELAKEKDKYWCHHCNKGLFFPKYLSRPVSREQLNYSMNAGINIKLNFFKFFFHTFSKYIMQNFSVIEVRATTSQECVVNFPLPVLLSSIE